MFRAIFRLSSEGQTVLIQHLVSSLTKSDDTRCCINPLNAELNPIRHLLALSAHLILHISSIRVNTIWPPEDKQDIARNMYM
jgi:hypothetical protein